MIDIRGLNKADVLAALYNASRPQGMGFMAYDPKPMTREEAENLLQLTPSFDYLKGRVMKLSLQRDDEFEEYLYDRDNGHGAAQRAIDTLRATNSTNAPEIQAAHFAGKTVAAEKVMDNVHRPSTIKKNPISGVVTATIGLNDVADHLIPAVDKAMKND